MIYEYLNDPIVVMIFGSLAVFGCTNKILAIQEQRKVKNRVFQVLIETRNLSQDIESYKTMRLIPSIFKNNPKVVKAYRNYIATLNPGRVLSDEEIASLTIETNYKYDDLITEIGRDIKMLKFNEFYQDNQEYVPQWIRDSELNVYNANKVMRNAANSISEKDNNSN